MSIADAGEAREPGQNFQFIAQVTDIFSSSAKTLADINEKVSLIATAGKYGLIFVSDTECIKVFETASLIDGHNLIPVVSIGGKGIITHISTSCDFQTLFVCKIINDVPFSFFYDIFSIVSCTSQPTPFYATPLCTLPGSRLASLSWNPCDPCCIVAAISNGDLSLIRMKEKSMEFSSAKGIKANAVTWSFKGKQLAVGKQDGTISLFKPDLTHVRDIEKPQNQEIGSVLNITWFTNTEFFIGYLINSSSAPVLFYVNAPKGKPATFYTFEDVCYSNEREKPVSYYSYFISEWNLLFVLSSNGIEMGVVGKSESSDANECQWCQWFPDDGARASMNFVNVVQETYPLGLAIDFTSTSTFISKDEQSGDPLPVLLSLSSGGELNIFFVENKLTETPNLSFSSEKIPSFGLRTAEQFGYCSRIPSPVELRPATILQLNRNTPSAFSSIPKIDVKNSISQAFSFSTPIKPLASPVTPTLFASPVISSALVTGVSSAESLNTITTSFTSPFVPKPVSLSSEVGVSSNLSKTLHVPSPKKSLGGAFSSISLPTPLAAASSAVTYPAQSSPSAVLKEIVPATAPPPPKVSKHQLMQLIKDEMNNFEMELLDNNSKNDALQYKVGEKVDEQKINAALTEINKWMSEMKKSIQEVNEDVCQLHKNTFDALASYEDTNSHCNIKAKSKNLVYMQLRPLDPYSQRRINEIRSKYYYLASQITEVDVKLDSLWEEYTTSKKSNIARRLKQSTTENMYRSVSNLHNSRVSYEKQLDQICLHLKKLYLNQLELSFLTNNMSLNSNSIDKASTVSPTVSHSTGKQRVSPKKITHLQEVLSKRVGTPVRKQRMPENSKNLVFAKSLETAASPTHSESKKSTATTSHNATLLSLLVNDPLANIKYEDISPPVSPKKSSNSSNPLAALSSLVGKVSQPNDQRLTGFSLLDATTVTKTAPSVTEGQLSQTVACASSQINKSLSMAGSSNLFSPLQYSLQAKPLDSKKSSLANMFKINNSSSSIMLPSTQNMQGKETLLNATIPSSVQEISIHATSPALFPNMFNNKSSNFSISPKNDDEFTPNKSAESSFPSRSFVENKTVTGGIFNIDKTNSTSVDSSSVFSKQALFSISDGFGSSPFSVRDTATTVPSKLEQGSFPSSSSIFGAPSITTSCSPLFSQSISSSASPVNGQHLTTINKSNSSKPTKSQSMASVSKILLPEKNSLTSTEITSTTTSISTSSGLSVSANSALSPFAVLFNTSTPSVFGLQTTTNSFSKPLQTPDQLTSTSCSTALVQPFAVNTTSFGQSPTLFSQSIVTNVSSLFSNPTVSSDVSSANKICSSTPLFSHDSSASSLFKQHSTFFEQKTTPASSTSSIFGGITSTIPAKICSEESTNHDNSNASVQASIVTTTASSEQSRNSLSTPLFGVLPTTSSEQSVAPNFSSLLKPLTTTNSLFSQIGSSTSVFGIQPGTSITLGQEQSPFTPTISTIQSAVTPPSASIFGSPPTTSSTNAFENMNLKSVTTESIFGNTPNSQSIFGNAGNNAPTSILSASSTSNTFSSGSVFGQNLPTTSATQSPLFGTSSISGSIFGTKNESQSSIFGNSSQDSTSIFGASNPSTTVSVTSSQQTPFSSGFGQQSLASSVFGGGSLFSGLGKAPSEENASKNVFGNLSGNTSSGPQTNLFGSGGGTSSSFGSLASTPNAPSGIGAFSPVKTGGSIFGGAPSFGGSPSFGSDLTKPRTIFGGAPTFGGPAPFGSTSPGSSIFGGNSAFGSGSTFGNSGSSSTSASSTFGGAPAFGAGNAGAGFSNFANAGGATFGSLAGNQSSTNSNATSFGGSSFSGWR